MKTKISFRMTLGGILLVVTGMVLGGCEGGGGPSGGSPQTSADSQPTSLSPSSISACTVSQDPNQSDEMAINLQATAATDMDGSSLTFSTVEGPSHGTLCSLGPPSCTTGEEGSDCTVSVSYTPDADYIGPDSFTYQANDGTVAISSSTVFITVASDSDAAVATDESATTETMVLASP